MTQIAFSHQFSNRWLETPQAVKNAIVQELDDIVHLLESDTDLKEFAFTTPDLHEYIEAVYASLAQKQEQQDEQEAYKVAENRMRQIYPLPKNNDEVVNTKSQSTVVQNQTQAPEVFDGATSIQTEQVDETLIAELEARIDGYLEEQFNIMSKDLKAWLRQEIKNNSK